MKRFLGEFFFSVPKKSRGVFTDFKNASGERQWGL